ncbi:uncharacterized protein KIAA2012 homolog [Dendronephthya gigantea]|uniref:uncharacterized protein KIAA2012 homolog n=1 Tax=Dendronephthya gigantea TaxID=151771 RepID=UPI00106A2C55|nr:uncharacterized protein KIAA2012 homolog [Dendronephthya gigantea]
MDQMDANNNSKDNTSKSLMSLKGCKEWLEQQRLNYETELNSMRKLDQEKLEGKEESSIEELCESVSRLQEELLDVSSTHSTKQLILERLLSGYVKMKILFPSGDMDSGKTSEQKEDEFASQCDEQQRLCKDIQKYQQALEEEEGNLRDIGRQRLEVTKRCEKLMAELQDLQTRKQTNKTERETKKESNLRQQIQERQNMMEVARNICQALVFGSGVDFSQDKELKEMILSFGRPINRLDL